MLQNKVMLTGNVGKDPEVKHLENGSIVANVSLATSEKYKDKKGEKMEHTEWHNLQFWGKQAEIIEKHVKKGHKLQIEGKLRTRKWEKDSVTHYTTEIFVNDFLFLSPVTKTGTTTTPEHSNPLTDINQGDGPQNDELSDLPF